MNSRMNLRLVKAIAQPALPAMLFALLMPAPAGAQNFPNKAVRLIVPSSPGSGFDVIGRITAAGPKGSVTVPAGATHVNLAGRTLMPALVNAHVHIGYEGYTSWGASVPSPLAATRPWLPSRSCSS